MTISELTATLHALSWKQSDFCQKSGASRNAVSRWMNGHTAIPDWVPSYLAAMLAIQQLHERVVRPAPRDARLAAQSDARQ